jgi:subtilisin
MIMANPNETTNALTPPQNAVADAPLSSGLAVPVTSRKRQVLISSRVIPGSVQPMSADSLQTALESIVGVKVIKRLKPQGLNALSVGGGSLSAEIVVAETTIEQIEALKASAPPNLIIEHNALLKHADDQSVQLQILRNSVEASLVANGGPSVNLQFTVTSETGDPIPKATVVVYGRAFPAQGETDATGQVAVAIYGGGPETVQAVYVKPARDYWEKFIQRPELFTDRTNILQLNALSKSFNDFPQTGISGWGVKLMGLDQQGAQVTGRGIKIGIIDSGCDNSHAQLQQVKNGMDFTNNRDAQSWTKDVMSHGTHCAGVIAGRSDLVRGIQGIAPDAEVHAFKVFPGGRFDDLISALDECIARGIDVVNLSLGSDQGSELVARKLAEARQNGIACIVAAGNSGGPVQFPGTVPSVLTVSAIGKMGEFPPDTNHAQTAAAGTTGNSGIFPAKFSCFGPEVAVCAPGVAIVSTVPGGYAAWDGTSMATPHVTGLAALLLAHHPSLKQITARTEHRVAMLFQIIKAMSFSVVSDVLHGGAGLPTTRGQSASVSPLPPVASQAVPVQQVQVPAPMQGNAGEGGYVQLTPVEQAILANQIYLNWLVRMQTAGMAS